MAVPGGPRRSLSAGRRYHPDAAVHAERDLAPIWRPGRVRRPGGYLVNEVAFDPDLAAAHFGVAERRLCLDAGSRADEKDRGELIASDHGRRWATSPRPSRSGTDSSGR